MSPIQTGTMKEFTEWAQTDIGRYNIDEIVAHNAKFDLKYLIRDMLEGSVEEPWHEINIHCTMTQEYLSGGQADKFITLEALAEKHGIALEKTMDLGAYLDSGGKMEDIPKDELRTYLEQDVEITTQIYLKQKRQEFNMKYLWPLAEMELNGLPIDRERTQVLAKDAAEFCDEFVSFVQDYIMSFCEWRDGDPITLADFEKKIKPTANRTFSFLLTGAPEEIRTTSDKWTVKWKAGHSAVISSAAVAKVYGKTKPTNLGYSMDETHMEKLLKHVGDTSWIHKIPKWRKLDKLLNTYYLPFLVKSEQTGCLHPKLNTTATATGRLSSSDPNGQNMPSEARSLVTAPEDYSVVELDFSQLELVALAFICKDKQMLEDINNGEDIHFNSGQTVMGWDHPSEMTKDDRKIVKNVNFGAVYGGKAPGLAYQTGVKKDTVQDLINSLYDRYPGIGIWQKDFYTEVVENMEPNGHDDNGEQLYKSTVECAGRTYTFFETPSPRWLRKRMGRGYSFNPNQVYNYPIQGYAGWQIVLGYLYKLWAQSHLNYKFIMTVHDSIVVLVPDEDIISFKELVQQVADDFSDALKLPVPLKVDCEVGKTWS